MVADVNDDHRCRPIDFASVGAPLIGSRCRILGEFCVSLDPRLAVSRLSGNTHLFELGRPC
jgi:hypothetical protein